MAHKHEVPEPFKKEESVAMESNGRREVVTPLTPAKTV